MDPGTAYLVKQFKAEIAKMGGNGFHALQRRFRIMDDNENKQLSLAEFKKGIRDLGMKQLNDGEIRSMFSYFDRDNSASIDFEEFIRGVRDNLNEKRLTLVKMAFTRLDSDGSGAATVDELKAIYDVTHHPHFINGSKTKEQILTTFMESFEQGNSDEVGDGKITEAEFINYYENLSICIDNDDYFELMIRNSWHMSGGVGQAANSANTRVLVTDSDGSQRVVEIQDDLGMKAGDREDAMRRLKRQGNNASSISFGDSSDSTEAPINKNSASSRQLLLQKYAEDQEKISNANAAPRSPIRAGSPAHSAGRKTSSVNVFSSSIGQLLVEGQEEQQAPPPVRDPKAFQLHHNNNHNNNVGTTNKGNQGNSLKAPEMPQGVRSLVNSFKEELKMHGAHGFHGLQRKFRIMDDNGNNRLSLGEFKKGVKELGLQLSDSEIRQIFGHFDVEGQGEINFNDFINVLRDELNENRLHLVNLAFSKLDINGDGLLDPTELMEKYDASQHPDVLTGRKTADQVLREWLTVFEVGGVEDGKVTFAEFENYYTNLGANIDRDDYFELMIRNAWHISGGEGAAANSANKRVLVTDNDGSQHVLEVKNDLGVTSKEGLFKRVQRGQHVHANSLNLFGGAGDMEQALPPPPAERAAGPAGRKLVTSKYQAAHKASLSSIGSAAALAGLDTAPAPVVAEASRRHQQGVPLNVLAASRARGVPAILTEVKENLSSKGARGIVGLSRKFKIMDDNGNGALSMSEFKKAMKECDMDLTTSETSALFSFFDKDGSGDIDFEEFLAGVRGPLTDGRIELVKMAYKKLDIDNDGIVDPSEIMSLYNANAHPDVLAGKKTPQEVLREFLETFEVGGEVDGKVTFDEFCNYYSNVSMSIDNDEYFELMIRNAWRISGGEGAAANSANKRVLVTNSDGSQEVVCLENDVASANPDKTNTSTLAELKKQGVDAISFSDSSTATAGSSASASGSGSIGDSSTSMSLPSPPRPRSARGMVGVVSDASPFSTNYVARTNPGPSAAAGSPTQVKRSYGHNNHQSSITF